MKRCPTCNQVYSDDTLNFCLTDGTSLSPAHDSKATVSIHPLLNTSPLAASPAQTPQSSGRGDRPILAYAVICFLLLLVGGGVVMWLKSNAKPLPAESQNATPPPTATPTIQSSNNTPVSKLYRVVGVAHDDVLYVRPKPGERDIYVGKIPANGVDIQILESGQRAGQSLWVKVNYKGITGWVNNKFLAEQ